MKPLSINIFFHTDETARLDEMGLDYDVDKCEVRPMIFYHINAVSPHSNGRYGLIYTNGSMYISPLSMYQLNDLINAK